MSFIPISPIGGSSRFFEKPQVTPPGKSMSKERKDYIFKLLKLYICQHSRYEKKIAENKRIEAYNLILEKRAFKARMCIIDSFEGRLKNGLATNYEHKDKNLLKYYAFYIGTHDFLFYTVLTACTFHTFSIFFDPINTCSSSKFYLFLQYLVYFIYFIDISLKVMYEGFQEYLSHDWQVLYLFNLIVGLCDLIIFNCTTLTNPLRPLAGLLRLRRGRKFFDVLKKMIPRMLHDLIPIVFFVVLISVLSTILFNNEISNFKFVNNSLYSWWFLILTNDNFEELFPNNMYGYLLYILFYFPLIYIGQRFLLNLIIGETYSTFQNFMNNRIKKDLIKSYRGILKTFETMVEDKDNKEKIIFMDQDSFQKCLQVYDPSLTKEDIGIYFELIASGNKEISKLQFLLLHQVLRIKFKHHKKDGNQNSFYTILKDFIYSPINFFSHFIFFVIPNFFIIKHLTNFFIHIINFLYSILPSTIMLNNTKLLNFLTSNGIFRYLSFFDILVLCFLRNYTFEFIYNDTPFKLDNCSIISIIYILEFILRLFSVDGDKPIKKVDYKFTSKYDNLSTSTQKSGFFSYLFFPITYLGSIIWPTTQVNLIYNPFPNIHKKDTKTITKLFVFSTIILIIYHLSTNFIENFDFNINDVFLHFIDMFKKVNNHLEIHYQNNINFIASMSTSQASPSTTSFLSSIIANSPFKIPEYVLDKILNFLVLPYQSYLFLFLNFFISIFINLIDGIIYILFKVYLTVFSLSFKCWLQLPAASFITVSTCTSSASSLTPESLALHTSLFKDTFSPFSIFSSTSFASEVTSSTFDIISVYEFPIDKVLLFLRLLRCLRIIELDVDLNLFNSNVLLILPDLCETLCFTFISSYFFGVLGHFLLGHAMLEWSSPLIGIIQAHKLNFMVNFLSSMEDSYNQIGLFSLVYYVFYLIFSLTVSNITLSIAIELHGTAVSKNDLESQRTNLLDIESALEEARKNASKRAFLYNLTSFSKLNFTSTNSEIDFIQFSEIKDLISIFLNHTQLLEFIPKDTLDEIFNDPDTLNRLKDYHSNQITGQYNLSENGFFSYLKNMYSSSFTKFTKGDQLFEIGNTIEKFFILIRGELLITCPSNQIPGEIDFNIPHSKTINKCVFNSAIILGGEFFSGFSSYNYSVVAKSDCEIMEISLSFFRGEFDSVLTGSFVKEASKSFDILKHRLQFKSS